MVSNEIDEVVHFINVESKNWSANASAESCAAHWAFQRVKETGVEFGSPKLELDLSLKLGELVNHGAAFNFQVALTKAIENSALSMMDLCNEDAKQGLKKIAKPHTKAITKKVLTEIALHTVKKFADQISKDLTRKTVESLIKKLPNIFEEPLEAEELDELIQTISKQVSKESANELIKEFKAASLM